VTLAVSHEPLPLSSLFAGDRHPTHLLHCLSRPIGPSSPPLCVAPGSSPSHWSAMSELPFSTVIFLCTCSLLTAAPHPRPAQPRLPWPSPSSSTAHRPEVPLRPPPIRNADDRLSAAVFPTIGWPPRWGPLYPISSNMLRRLWARSPAPPFLVSHRQLAGIGRRSHRQEEGDWFPCLVSWAKNLQWSGQLLPGWAKCPMDRAHCNSDFYLFPNLINTK
jgi:hypothetical protein